MTNRLRALALAALATLTATSTPAYAQTTIKVLADEPLQWALAAVAEAYRHESGQTVEFAVAPSPALSKRVVDGEAADVVLLQPNFVDRLAQAGKVAPGPHPMIGRAGFGIAARAGAPARDVRSVDAFKQVVLSADALIFNDRASGDHFASVLERLGIADAVKGKVTRVPPAAVFERVGRGMADDIGVGTIPQIAANKSLRLIGPLPPEFQSHIVYAAAPMTHAASAQAAEAFIAFLVSPPGKTLLIVHGIE